MTVLRFVANKSKTNLIRKNHK